MTPELIEPMNMLASRKYTKFVFVGPAQAAKTESFLLNWVCYTVMVDPSDLAIFSPTMGAARDFSIRRMSRMHRDSVAIGEQVMPETDADNLFDKKYKNGVLVNISWPSVTNFAGRPIPRVALTDYDRIPDDIGGDGNAFDLAAKRATTFGRFAMVLAESSPSRPVKDPKWLSSRPHEAPPTDGILALYNRGTCHRLYWPCTQCGEFFEGDFRTLRWDDLENEKRSAATVRMVCPHCYGEIPQKHRDILRIRSRWVGCGQTINKAGEISGECRSSDTVSYWLKGTAAAFIEWDELVLKYLLATKEFERTSTETALTTFWNTDAGEPYIPKSVDAQRSPEVLRDRAQSLPRATVPVDCRFLIAAVDVQQNLFSVAVWAIRPGTPFDMLLIDRFEIRKSKRTDDDEDVLWVKPGTYLEDWDLLHENVVDKRYPLEGDDSRLMQVKLTVCDSGGKAGVTTNAYDFVRKLRRENKAHNFHLIKGEPKPNAPTVQVRYPDSNDRGWKAVAKGDVPVMFLNSNALKDAVSNRLDCVETGKGMIVLPEWADDTIFTELCAESRTAKGWEAPNRRRNETWDLAYYCVGACQSSIIGADRINWNKPPAWANPWATNILVSKAVEDRRFAFQQKVPYDFGKLGAALA
jgi:phage terminase large subunit GpA-like protein